MTDDEVLLTLSARLKGAAGIAAGGELDALYEDLFGLSLCLLSWSGAPTVDGFAIPSVEGFADPRWRTPAAREYAVEVARAILGEPRVVAADEPCG